ncbi:MAG: BMC domain protein [Candidatus Tectomicrobia bacterium]|uniref:BMC domain protein n=1 Tax=Tectimicrobiota bacterium TaxID=2528274 RepID=A0A933LPG1_UNCTE|nr:BMC domain protein [Candidatus Tectomicrobia bacterium]
MSNVQLIYSPTKSTMEMLKARMPKRCRDLLEGDSNLNLSAIGLVQGKVIDMIAAADLADKVAPIFVSELYGLCPQHISMIAIFGDTEAVSSALKAIEEHFP